jgi:hypothetical protein
MRLTAKTVAVPVFCLLRPCRGRSERAVTFRPLPCLIDKNGPAAYATSYNGEEGEVTE